MESSISSLMMDRAPTPLEGTASGAATEQPVEPFWLKTFIREPIPAFRKIFSKLMAFCFTAPSMEQETMGNIPTSTDTKSGGEKEMGLDQDSSET